MSEDDIRQALDLDSMEKIEHVRRICRESGRLDVLADFDANMRDLKSGVQGARSAWHSISAAQRRVLLIMETGRCLVRPPHSRTRCYAIGAPHALRDVCSIATARALCARALIACDGTVFDPEAKFVLTERGRFVLAHGRTGDDL